MESIRAWLQDRKNLPIVAVGTAIIVIVVVLVFLRQTGTIGGGQQAAVDTRTYDYSSQPQTQYPQTPGPAGTPTMPPGTPGAAPAGVPDTTPTDMTGQQVATASQVQPPMLPYRKDPFQPFAGRPTRAHMLSNIVPTVSSRRLAPPSRPERLDVPMDIPDVLPPQPYRRMVGVMWNGQVSAILETEGVSEIVRPGMRVPTSGRPTALVESIEPDAIILKTLDTPRPMTIRVNMAGAISSDAYDAGVPEYGTPGYGPPGYGVPTPGRGTTGAPMPMINP